MSEILSSAYHRILFSTKDIGGKKAPNRFAAQPMEANDGDPGGKVSQRTLDRYRKIALGGWGITTVEAASVTSGAVSRNNQLVVSRSNLDGFCRLVDTYKRIHPEGLLMFQLTHPGQYDPPYMSSPDVCDGILLGSMSDEDIKRLRQRFIEAAGMLREAGADGIDFKIGHGCFVRDMISPSNVRNDRWGCSFENRIRFLRTVLEELRSIHAQGEFILGARVSMYEAVIGGCGTASPDSPLEDLAEMKRICALIAELGGDFLNVSAGLPGETSGMIRPANRSHWISYLHFRYCHEARQAAGDMTLIGSAYTILREQSLLRGAQNIHKGFTDIIGYGRQIFADPLFPKKIKQGEPVDFCRTCGGCSKLMNSQMHAGCVVYNPYYRGIMHAAKLNGSI